MGRLTIGGESAGTNVTDILRDKLKRRNMAAHPSRVRITQPQADDATHTAGGLASLEPGSPLRYDPRPTMRNLRELC